MPLRSPAQSFCIQPHGNQEMNIQIASSSARRFDSPFHRLAFHCAVQPSSNSVPPHAPPMNAPPSGITRRRFMRDTAAGIALASIAPVFAADAPPARQFRLWAIGDPHVGTDIARKRESLADAI